MKKLYLFLFIVLLARSASATPGSLVSVSPDSAFQSQYLNVTITYPAGTFISFGSPGDLHFNSPGLSSFIIDWMNLYSYDPFNDVVEYSVQVPTSQAPGIYNLTADVGYWDWMTNSVIATDSFYLPNAFIVLEANVYGRIFFDNNSNGIYEPGMGERLAWGRRIDVSPDSISTYTDGNGVFQLRLQPGTHTIRYTPAAGETVTTGNSPYVANVTSVSHDNIGDIGVLTPPDYEAFSSIWLGRRCNRVTPGYLYSRNNGNRPMNISATVVKSPNITILSTSTAPSSASGDTMTWIFNNLMPGEYRWVYITDSIPSAGDTIHYSATTVSYNGSTPMDTSAISYSFIVNCSYDPNDKSVVPAGENIQHYTLLNQDMYYHINFQNTGNDTALDVIVRDTLDPLFDLSTFEFLGSSAQAVVSLDYNTRVVEFRMSNILLPDSNINEPGSHGFVEFRIRHLPGIADGSVINNTADIYFDFNPPVATNTTMNTMVHVIPTGIRTLSSNPGINIYPNPFDREAILDLRQFNGRCHLDIWNETGSLTYSEDVTTTSFRLSSNKLSPGIYLFRVSSGGNESSGRFVVMPH